MIRLINSILILIVIALCITVYFNSTRNFEAKFKNIDGLPVGAQVTALGVPIGKVTKTRSSEDGIIVTVKITNKNVNHPEPGSQLSITSLGPNQGRVLEIISPNGNSDNTKAWIIQEPITTRSWLNASIELLDNLKAFSETVIRHVTPENFKKVRLGLQKASEALNETANKLAQREKDLIELRERFSEKTSETNLLISKLHKPIKSLNAILNDKNLKTSIQEDFSEFSTNLTFIAENVTMEDFLVDIKTFKAEILDRLNKINTSFANVDKEIADPILREKIKTFNKNLANLNDFTSMVKESNVQAIKQVVKKAKEITSKASELTKQN